MSAQDGHGTGNYADLDYTGIHSDISVYQFEGEYYWILIGEGFFDNGPSHPIGPFSTSAEAYHNTQGF